MKKIYTFVLLAAVNAALFGQSPQLFSYQAVIRDANGNLVSNNQVGIRIQILSGSEDGQAVYTEEHTPVSNANGLVTLEIGNGNAGSGVFAGIDWSDGVYFIKMEADAEGGSNYNVSGVSRILSVPYALHAKTAEILKPHFIGEIYGGGIVFHVWENGQHGLIAAPQDLATGIRWYAGGDPGIYTPTMAKNDGIISGRPNTAIIIAVQGYGDGETYAARICNETSALMGLAYGDWYLPSKYELNLMFLRQGVIGNLAAGNYWSSTESNNAQAWSQDFSSGLQSQSTKNNTYRVRPVRAF